MILFDPEQSEAVEGFPGLAVEGDSRAGLPARPTLMRYLREAQTAVGLKGEVSVLLTTDDGIRALNRRFRKKNKATDVLSFPVDDPSFGSAGDLAISIETAARQAAEQGHSLRVEVRVLMLHGLLHLAGMDHETDEGKMARKERRLREKLGLPMGLIERVVGVGPQGLKPRIKVDAHVRAKARTLQAKAVTVQAKVRTLQQPDESRSVGKAHVSKSRRGAPVLPQGLKPFPEAGKNVRAKARTLHEASVKRVRGAGL